MPPPRLYVQVAARASVALVFARGPSAWWSLRRWDLDSGALEMGAWFRGTLYPRRSDLSPDGRYLYYFALKAASPLFLGTAGLNTFSAVSRAPWLHTLAAWRESGTWTRGYHFVDRRRDRDRPPRPAGVTGIGDLGQLQRYDLVATSTAQYAAERRRRWVEHPACPPRAATDLWDERRSVILVRDRPRGDGRLVLRDHGWNPHGAIEGRSPSYELELRPGAAGEPLVGAVWADWDPSGRLLVATDDGRLQIRRVRASGVEVVCEHELAAARPDPRPPPPEARHW